MSRNLYITCEKCKERLWIGQGNGTFYSEEKNVMNALGKFLFEHESSSENHNLQFKDDNADDSWYDSDSVWKKWS